MSTLLLRFAVLRRFWLKTGTRLPLMLLLALCLPALLPLVVILTSLTQPFAPIWQHLSAYVLPEAVRHTVLLALGVGGLSLMLGAGLAWLTALYRFPGRRFFAWALMLPLALPTYVLT